MQCTQACIGIWHALHVLRSTHRFCFSVMPLSIQSAIGATLHGNDNAG